MKKQAIKIASIVVATIALAVTGIAFAQGPPDGMGRPGMCGPGGMMGGERGAKNPCYNVLDDTQKEKADAIIEASKAETDGIQEKMQALHEELRDLISSGASEATVFAKVDEMSVLQTQMMKARISSHLKIFALLTDEQKEQIEEMKTKREAGERPGKDKFGGKNKGGRPNKGNGGYNK